MRAIPGVLMRSLNRSFGLVSIFTLSSVAIAIGCSTSSTEDLGGPSTPSTSQPTDPSASSSTSGSIGGSSGNMASSGGPGSSTSSSGSHPTDGGKDSGKPDSGTAPRNDAGDGGDGGSHTVVPGTKCATVGALFREECGYCGTRETVCDGTDMNSTWTDFGPCLDEVVSDDRCMPGTTGTSSCGKCGTMNIVCQRDCHAAMSTCVGEKADGCYPGEVAYLTAACMTPGTVREHTCSATCAWGVATALPCKVQDADVIASAIVGNLVTARGKLAADRTIGALGSGTCGGADAVVDPATLVPYAYTIVRNPLDRKIKVEVLYRTPATGHDMSTYTAAYAGKQVPTDRTKCIGAVSDYCGDTVCGDSWSGLLGANAVTIEPHDYIIVYTGSYEVSQVGDFEMVIRTTQLL